VGKVFDVPPFYHIKNGQLSEGLTFFTGFIHFWHMPLFFLLAGWAAQASLSTRGTSSFLHERVRRILIPFALGVVVLCPPLKYLELKVIGPPGYNESFLQFLPTFLGGVDRFTWGHLWFLIYLLTFTLLYLPILTWLQRRPFRLPHIAQAWVYLPLIPLIAVQIALRGRWPGWQNLVNDWANFTYYSLYFLYGFALARFPELEAAVHREWPRALAIGLTAALTMIPWDYPYALEWACSTLVGYCLVIGFYGLAHRSLNFTGAAHRYLTEAAFPIYLLHQSAIVFIGYWVIRQPWGIAAKAILLLASSTTATFGVYHFVVRPLNPLRFMCGMKPAYPRGISRTA
jgi:peptidoglycan/LPS O-acetylase OafA/YrhL